MVMKTRTKRPRLAESSEGVKVEEVPAPPGKRPKKNQLPLPEDGPKEGQDEKPMNLDEVVTAIKDHAKFLKSFDVKQVGEAVRKADNQMRLDFWNHLLRHSAETMLNIVPRETETPSSGPVLDDHETAILSIATLGLHLTETLASQEQDAAAKPWLFKLLKTIDGCLKFKCLSKKLLNVICRWCEAWHHLGPTNEDRFGQSALEYLVQNLSTVADIKRLLQLKDALATVCLPEQSNFSIINGLLASVKSPLVLRCPEGNRWLTFLFCLSPSLVPRLHGALKEVLPGSSVSLSQSLGEVYLKAWKTSEGPTRDRIEEDCLQDLMHRGIFAKKGSPGVFQPISAILNVFHKRKNDRQLQGTLCRLYQPILWRNLRAGNPKVRANAAQFLFDAFPIENPDDNIEERSAQQEVQIRAMGELLQDEYPEVRLVAIQGISRVLSTFWLVISSADVNSLMKVLTQDLCFDASSFRCRAAAVEGLKYLVNRCPRSHMYLKKVLPKVAMCLFDVKDRVRMAMVDLLLQVKRVKLIQLEDVCEERSLLAQLGTENNSKISYKIVHLLIKSYFPIEGPESNDENEKIRRCIRLLKEDRRATRKFYRFCDKSCELHHWVKFALAILLLLRRFAKKKITEGKEKSLSQSGLEESTIKDASSSHSVLSDSTNTSGSRSRKRKLYKLRQSTEFEMAPCESVIPADEYLMVDASGRMDNSIKIDEKATNSSSTDKTELDETEGTKAVDDLYEELENSDVVAGLLDVVCIVWMSRSREIGKPENVDFRSLLEKKSSKMLMTLFKYYKTSTVCRPLIFMSSFLPHSAASMTASFCLSKLRNHQRQTDPREHICIDPDEQWNGGGHFDLTSDDECITVYVDAICNWKRGDDLIDIVLDWLQRGLKDQKKKLRFAGSPRKSLASTRGVRFAEVNQPPKMKEALEVIKYILRHPVNRATLLRKHRNHIMEISKAMLNFLPVISAYFHSHDLEVDDDTKDMWSSSWEIILKIMLLMKSDESCEKEQFVELLEWTKKNIIPVLPVDRERFDSSKAEVGEKFLNFHLNTIHTAIQLMLVNVDETTAISCFTESLTNSLNHTNNIASADFLRNVLYPALRVLNSLCQWIENNDDESDRKEVYTRVKNTLMNILKYLRIVDKISTDPEEDGKLKALVPKLRKCLSECMIVIGADIMEQITEEFIESIAVALPKQLADSQDGEFSQYEAFLCGILISKTTSLKAVFALIQSRLQSSQSLSKVCSMLMLTINLAKRAPKFLVRNLTRDLLQRFESKRDMFASLDSELCQTQDDLTSYLDKLVDRAKEVVLLTRR